VYAGAAVVALVIVAAVAVAVAVALLLRLLLLVLNVVSCQATTLSHTICVTMSASFSCS
jgi:hypothetical protein